MKRALKLFLGSLLLCNTLILSTASAKENPKVVLGYYTQDENAYSSLITNYSYLSQISTDTFTFDEKGNVLGSAPKAAVSFANTKKIKTYAAVSNWKGEDFNAELAHKVVSDPKVKKAAISGLLQMVKGNGYKGVNIDFENINASDRVAFSSFIKDIAVTLGQKGYQTMVSVPAKFEDNPSDAWSGAFDYKALGKYVNYIQVMTYDQNGPWGSPGPVAGKAWIEEVLQYSVSDIPANKVIMGVPAYGYDWNETKNKGEAVGLKDIPSLIASTGAVPKWDETSSSMYFHYQSKDSSKHVVWYENAKSIQEKTHFTVAYNLAGISVWSMGTEDAGFWKAIKAGLQ
jgi:spore germination protein